jgi:hypothetical protein
MTAGVQESTPTPPAHLVAPTATGQEMTSTQHDGNQQAVSSSALADRSSMEEVPDTADGDQQSSGEVTRTTSACRLRKRAKMNKRRKGPAYHAPPPPGP